METIRQLRAEIESLVRGRAGLADGILPPIVFVVALPLGVVPAAVAGTAIALAITLWRLLRRRPLRYAISGLLGTAVAATIAARTGRAETYFLPGIISGAVLTLVLLGSITFRRPLVAWMSWMARSWPLEWYWHPRVRPAYTLVTWLWLIFFGLRTAVQAALYVEGSVATLAVVRAATGWPSLIVLLAVSYLLGRYRLTQLEGPSVEEWENLDPPPWSGQSHGF